MAEDNFDIYEVALKENGGQLSGSNASVEGGDGFSLYDDLVTGEEPYRESRSERSQSPEPSTPKSDQEVIEHHSSDQTAVYIGGLTWWTTDQDLETLFSEYGRVKSVKFFEDKVNGKSKGYALIEFANPDSAHQARDKLNGREINGKQCVINFVNPENLKQLNRATSSGSARPPRSERRGGGGGDRGRDRGGGGFGRSGRMPSGFSGNPLEMMARSGFFRGRGVGLPVPDPRMLSMPMAHVNPAFLPGKEGEHRDYREEGHRAREDYYRDKERDREREEREREDRYRKREREEASRHKEERSSRESGSRDSNREKEDRKRHKETTSSSRDSGRDRKH